MPIPASGSPEAEELACFLKYIVSRAAIDSDLLHRLAGAPTLLPAEGELPRRLRVVPSDPLVRRQALEELFRDFGDERPETGTEIWERARAGSLDAYSALEIDFVQAWGGASYITDSAGKFRVLITPTPAPMTYMIGTAGTPSTPGNAIDLDECN